MPGPLTGYRIVEVAGIGPGPFCALMLADMGADVVRVKRPADPRQPDKVQLGAERGMRCVHLDLKNPAGRDALLQLASQCDALIEGNRPGVMERLGVGPQDCLARNPRLVYGRMTGWGQEGPLAGTAGHDINYIAITGALAAIGPRDKPIPPLNLVGDFGGGAMMLAFGIVCALLEANRSGKGQVVDAAMSDGASLLMMSAFGQLAAGRWHNEREANIVDGGAHFYGTYRCADGKWIAIGAIEPQFYALLLRLMGLEQTEFEPQNDSSRWPAWKNRFAEVFATRTRDEWCAVMEGSDACFAPVLDLAEAFDHPHHAARGTFVEVDGRRLPAPAPRFSRTVTEVRLRSHQAEAEILKELGLSRDQIAALTGGR